LAIELGQRAEHAERHLIVCHHYGADPRLQVEELTDTAWLPLAIELGQRAEHAERHLIVCHHYGADPRLQVEEL
ncbi:hypothetical protein CJ738_36245, partial [Klebsiella pneumoniae]